MTIEPAAAPHGETRSEQERLRRDAALDETIEQSFPASDRRPHAYIEAAV